ncbi:hypothetical protein [Stieleria sedimenti]|nr:hypothetical protein [Stieleria sedimenti]
MVPQPGNDVANGRYFPIYRPTFFDLSLPGNVASVGGRTKLVRILSAKRWLERSTMHSMRRKGRMDADKFDGIARTVVISGIGLVALVLAAQKFLF